MDTLDCFASLAMTTFNVVIVKATLAAFDEVTRAVGLADYMRLEQRHKGGGPPFS